MVHHRHDPTVVFNARLLFPVPLVEARHNVDSPSPVTLLALPKQNRKNGTLLLCCPNATHKESVRKKRGPAPAIAQLVERQTVEVTDICWSLVRFRVAGLFPFSTRPVL